MSRAPRKNPGGWLNVNETAEMLGLHNNTVKRIAPEALPYMRVAKRGDRRYRIVDVEAYIEQRMVRRG